MAVYGYARALPGQDEILTDQLTTLKVFGKADWIYQESAPLFQVKRDRFLECTSALVAGDELVVTNLSVLGMRHFDLLSFFPNLRDRGINFRSIRDNITTRFEMDCYDVFEALAKCEIALKIERRLIDGLQKKRGPKQKLEGSELNRAREMAADGLPLSEIASVMKVSKATLSRRL